MAEIFEIFRQQLTSGSGGQVPSQDRPLDYTDEALALRFTREHGENLRYVSLWGKWLFWEGQRWRIDETELVKDYCRAIARAASSEILEQEEPNYKLAATVASAKTIYAIEKLARADRKHASTPDDWDANPWIINTPDGTVDLTTGLMRPHDRKDYCTKMTAVGPGGDWPRRPSRTKGKVPLFIIGVDAVKDSLFARLRLTESGPGCMHFPQERDADYFRQLTAERVVTRFERGRPIRSWQPRREGERNEALDTYVYATAALYGLISMGLRLNEETEKMVDARSRDTQKAKSQTTPVTIRSQWMA